MIQRIQSIFLLLAALAFGAMFLLPMASSSMSLEGFFADREYDVTDHVLLAVLAGLGALITLINIFQYRKRTLQLRLGYLAIVMGILIPVMAYMLFTNQAAIMPQEMEVSDEPGMFLPLVVIVCVVAANLYIRKDEKLVRSMDRLR